jgi:succinoglycan biosynthesis transport protein ExoP
MYEYQSFDAVEYVEYLRKRWLVIAIACAAAVLLALGVSLLLPKQYTATTRILIEPPGTSDARLTTAVSAMYLESLKTYELFANSDSLFARAADRFHLRTGESQPIESLKRRVLKVSKLRDTKILEISAVESDPKLAQAVAQYIAEETISTSHSENLASDRDFVEAGEKQSLDALRRLNEVQAQWSALSVSAPVESLQSEIDANVDLRSKVEQELVDAESEAAEYQAQAKDGAFAREQLSAAQARVALLERRTGELQKTIQEKTTTLASRTAQRQALETELKVAQKSYETVAARVQESRSSAGTHSEQLRIIDPGIVPQRPSSPNTSLNAAAALLVAFLLSVAYLSCAFVYRRRAIRYETPLPHELRR